MLKIQKIYLAILVIALLIAAGIIGTAVLGESDMPVSRGPEWEKIHEALTHTPGKENIQLLFLGDSITCGWRDAGRNVMISQWGRYHPDAFGIWGDSTQALLWRIKHGELNDMHPKAVVLLIGTNNLSMATAESIAGAIQHIVDNIHDALPETTIVLMGILPRGAMPDNPQRSKINSINQIIKKYENGSFIRYIDVGNVLLQPDGTISPEVMADYLHPTTLGYLRISEALKPLIDPILMQ